jgi:hypothetical protein
MGRRKFRKIIVVVGLMVSSILLLGQSNIEERFKKLEEEIKALKEENKALRQKLEEIEKKKVEVPTISKEVVKEVLKEEKIQTYPKMEFKVTSYLGYKYDLSRGAGDKNEFEISRFYLYWLGTLRDGWKFRATLDAGIRNADSATTDRKDFKVLLKHGYLSYAGFKDMEIMFGLADLGWVGFWERKYLFRYQGSIMVDREGYITSTDLGIGVKGALFEKVLDYHLSFVNSEGWTTPEANKYKSFDGRISVNPFKEGIFKDLGIHTYWEIGNYDIAKNRLRFIAGATYKYGGFNIGGHYFWAKDPADRMKARQKVLNVIPAAQQGQEQVATGYTVHLIYNFKALGLEKLSFLTRYDYLDPSGRLVKDSHWRLILGPEWKFTDNVSALLNFERTQYKANAKSAGERDSSLLRLDVELKF